jgi:hypothetical protein
MRYDGLFEDFNNVRETQTYAVGKVVDEAQNYIEYLEGKEDVLNKLVDYFNQLDESKGFESKKEILDKVLTILPSE